MHRWVERQIHTQSISDQIYIFLALVLSLILSLLFPLSLFFSLSPPLSHKLITFRTLKRSLQRNTLGTMIFDATRAWFHGFVDLKGTTGRRNYMYDARIIKIASATAEKQEA